MEKKKKKKRDKSPGGEDEAMPGGLMDFGEGTSDIDTAQPNETGSSRDMQFG